MESSVDARGGALIVREGCVKKGVEEVVLGRDPSTSYHDSTEILHSSKRVVSSVTNVVLDDAFPMHVRREETDGQAKGASCVHHQAAFHEGREAVA